MYYPFMADWLRVFPREQVMVIRYEDYVAKPSETINNVCKFLNISKNFSVVSHLPRLCLLDLPPPSVGALTAAIIRLAYI